METIQPEQRAAVIQQLQTRPSRRPSIRVRPDIEGLLTLAASVNLAALPWRTANGHQRVVHETNCRHVTYHLTCAEFEMLEREADGFCDLCSVDMRPCRYTPEIDHDHAIGWRAVRGLICPSCNRKLAWVDAGLREPTHAMKYYLENPWHARVGLELLTCPSECAVVAHRAG